jgi:putative colanic acid biosynthesis glycosyltransferase
MSKPRVAIIVPCYNGISTLADCIQSALQQSYDHIHVHVQDGGSTDGSLVYLQSIRSPKFSFQSAPDGGVYDAINKGIQAIDADWYYILGSDDRIPGMDAIASVMAFGSQDIEILYGDVRYGQRTNKLVPHVHQSRFDGTIYWKNSLHQQGAFYRSALLRSHPFLIQYKILADYALHLLLYRQGIRTKHVGMTLCECSAAGLSKNFTLALYWEELKIKWKFAPLGLFLLNIPWVGIKFLAKKFSA